MTEEQIPLWFAKYIIGKYEEINLLYYSQNPPAALQLRIANVWIEVLWRSQKQSMWTKEDLPHFTAAFQRVMETALQFPTPALFLQKLSEIKNEIKDSL